MRSFVVQKIPRLLICLKIRMVFKYENKTKLHTNFNVHDNDPKIHDDQGIELSLSYRKTNNSVFIVGKAEYISIPLT